MHASRLTRRRFAAALALTPAALAQTVAPPRQRRAESFFGLHFDLHPSDRDPALGRDVSPERVEKLLRATRPDYVQYDAKGHVGWLGWPSEVGPSAPHIVNDSLAIWRRVTAKEGVALYIHFSGVWDSQAVQAHPEWARLSAEGKRDDRNTSVYGPYVDQRMIPQLREAATKYDLDGVWVDGECWSVAPDYAPVVLAEFRRRTGLSTLPGNAQEPGWFEFLEINREGFRRYLRHYVGELHKSHPRFQVASNWLYSTMVPEQPEIPVDFISGDYLGNASISTARIEARYMSQTGKPWDLMAWGFQQANSNSIGHIHKPAVQLQQESGVVLMQGGGFQVYYVPSRAGWFEDSHIEVMGGIASFCRARQSVSHQTETEPQVGVVFSSETLYRTGGRMFGGWGRNLDPVRGWIDALCECQWSSDLLPDWKLASMLARYKTVVLPEWAAIGDRTASELLAWVRGGGKLIFSGVENTVRFAREMGLTPVGKPDDTRWAVGGGETLANVRGLWQDIEPGAAKVLETRHPDMDSTRDPRPAVVAAPLGGGEMVAIPGPLGRIFAATHSPAVRRLIRRIVQPRFTPLVKVEAPPVVEVALRRKQGRLLVHLLNTAGMQVAGDYAAVDFIPAVGPVTLRFDPRLAASAVLHPGGRALAVTSGALTLPRLAVHAVVELKARA